MNKLHSLEKKLFRYELYCNDEPQDVGFLVGLEDLGLSFEHEISLLQPFNEELIIPNISQMRNSMSFFTEYGNEKFHDAILAVIDAYEGSIFEIKTNIVTLPYRMFEHIIYEDKYQVCLPKEVSNSPSDDANGDL